MQRFLATLLALLGLACGGGSSPPSTTARFDLAALEPTHRDFFALPFPTDLRRTAVGVELAGFPDPGASQVLADYATMLRTDGPGFAGAGALFASFSGALDPATLPADAAATLAPAASVYAVDLDAAGARTPLKLRYSSSATLFLPPNTLSALPLYGWPLAAGHRHALVVTTAVHDAAGHPLGAADGMRRALGLANAGSADADAVRITAPFVAWAKASGLDLRTVALASVFKVQDAAAPIAGLRAGVLATAAPTATDLTFLETTSSKRSHVFVGHLPVPNFQQGVAPYTSAGGRMVFGPDGVAQPQHTESVRFALSLPAGAPPAGGFPVVLYAHGTGGWYLSSACEGIGDLLAARGIASLAIDQVVHGPRNPNCHEPPPSPGNPLCLSRSADYEPCVGTAYFNLLNPWAGRDNTRQGAADLFQLIRLVPSLVVPATLHPEHLAAGLDSTHVAFMGHSQGGLTGAPFVAAEPGLNAAVLSGTGGTLAITVLQRKDPLDFKALTELLLGIDGRESLDGFHPVLSVVQTAGEPADPLSYGPHLVKDPIGGASRHVLMTEGLLDVYTVPDASEALGASALFDIGGAAAHQADAFTARGLRVLPLPLQANVDSPSGKKTGVLMQYPGYDHFAIFDSCTAQCHYLGFLDSAMKTGVATIPTCTCPKP